MNRSKIKRALIALPFVALAMVLMMGASDCSEHAVAKSDETVCVFDGSDRGAQKLKYQLLPGQNPRNTDSNDEVVSIPASYRFYAAFRDRQRADAGAPDFYIGYAKGNTPVQVEGQFRFRFNIANACDWYAKHGRRNTDDNGELGFNARTYNGASALSPWVKWLNENFGAVAAATIKTSSYGYTWPQLVYGKDNETDADLVEPVDVSYGKNIGRVFTSRLEKSLGGKFFCGTDASIWNDVDINPDCPPIFFETGTIRTADRGLMDAREKTEKLRADLENERVQAQISSESAKTQAEIAANRAKQQEIIRAGQVATERRAEINEQKVLRQKLITAKLRAQADINYQRCITYAKLGLDCEGRRPDNIIVGLPQKSG